MILRKMQREGKTAVVEINVNEHWKWKYKQSEVEVGIMYTNMNRF